jgi:hypothetical protein
MFGESRAVGGAIGAVPRVSADPASSDLVTVPVWLLGDECVIHTRTPLRLKGRRISELLYRGRMSVTVAVRRSVADGELVHHNPENVRPGRF